MPTSTAGFRWQIATMVPYVLWLLDGSPHSQGATVNGLFGQRSGVELTTTTQVGLISSHNNCCTTFQQRVVALEDAYESKFPINTSSSS